MNPSYNSGGIYSSGVTPPVTPSAPISTPPSSMQIGGSSRKPRKGIVIGAILIVVALVLGILAVVLMPKGGGGNSGNAGNNVAFNRLINYVVSGDELTSKVTDEYDYGYDYYFLEILDSDDDNAKVEVYDTTGKLLRDFVNSYDKENENLDMAVKSTQSLFDFIDVVYRKEENNGENILSSWIANGQDIAKQEAMNYYNLSTDNDNAYINEFLEYYEIWVDAVLEKIDFYNGLGCIADNQLDYECMVSKNTAETQNRMNEISRKVSEAYDEMLYYFDLARNFVAGVFSINNILNNNGMMGGDDE